MARVKRPGRNDPYQDQVDLTVALSETAFFKIPNARQALDNLVAHAREHDAHLEQPTPEEVTVHAGNGAIWCKCQDDGLKLEVSAISEPVLFFLKESTLYHLAAVNAEAADAIRWTGKTNATTPTSATPPGFHELTVMEKTAPLSGLIRLKLSSKADISNLSGPGIHVKLMVPTDMTRPPVWPGLAPNGATQWPVGDDALHVRYYTIKSLNPDTRTLEIDVALHEGGHICDWTTACKPGDRLGILGPAGGETPPQSGTLFFAGDQTALPAIARMVELLPKSATGTIIAEAESVDALRAYLPKTGLTLHALKTDAFRGEIVSVSEELSAGADFAWFAGEFQTAQDMRVIFKKKLGLKKGEQFSIGYWRADATH